MFSWVAASVRFLVDSSKCRCSGGWQQVYDYVCWCVAACVHVLMGGSKYACSGG